MNKIPEKSKIEKLNIDLIAHPDIINPFTEITRRTRKYLLLSSFIGFTVTWAGFVPNKIEALGITLTEVNKDAIFILIIITLSYFIVAFWIYANTDLIRYNILTRAGNENIRNSSGRQLLAAQEALKSYQEHIKNAKSSLDFKSNPKLPRPPSEAFEAAKLTEQIQEPQRLYKYSKGKVIFDKYFPILSGQICLLFISMKLLTSLPDDPRLIYLSISAVILINFALLFILKFKVLTKKYIIHYDKAINFYNRTNNKFIMLQQNLHKPDSKRYQMLEVLRVKLAKKAIDNMLAKQKKRFLKAGRKNNNKAS